MKLSLFIITWIIIFVALLALLPLILYLLGLLTNIFSKKKLEDSKIKHYSINGLKEPKKIIK
ncbi:hypothetical protein GF371_02775 [Candidatus Woesearchaeota archaeon]|nr:hypothetical protein [Candidatus Woesearchaeota archaeon]